MLKAGAPNPSFGQVGEIIPREIRERLGEDAPECLPGIINWKISNAFPDDATLGVKSHFQQGTYCRKWSSAAARRSLPEQPPNFPPSFPDGGLF
jgi:hypothetical protein